MGINEEEKESNFFQRVIDCLRRIEKSPISCVFDFFETELMNELKPVSNQEIKVRFS